jgi:hypothetical protein
MQKALRQMNVQLANLISDRSGLTGQAIMRAIIAGERDAIISQHESILPQRSLASTMPGLSVSSTAMS